LRLGPALCSQLDGLDKRAEGKEPGSLADTRCSAAREYASAKLALLVHSSTLDQRLGAARNGAVAHTVNPGAMLGRFHANDAEAPGSVGSLKAKLMGYMPPVWIMKQVYRLVFTNLGNAMLRDSTTGAKAVYHVASAAALGQRSAGGGVYSDQKGAFDHCDSVAERCGRMALHEQPAAAANKKLAEQLWARTEKALGAQQLRALPLGAESAEEAETDAEKEEAPEWDFDFD
jgi:hypothetical protein